MSIVCPIKAYNIVFLHQWYFCKLRCTNFIRRLVRVTEACVYTIDFMSNVSFHPLLCGVESGDIEIIHNCFISKNRSIYTDSIFSTDIVNCACTMNNSSLISITFQCFFMGVNSHCYSWLSQYSLCNGTGSYASYFNFSSGSAALHQSMQS